MKFCDGYRKNSLAGYNLCGYIYVEVRQGCQANTTRGDVMTKQEFKSKMSAFRKSVSAASWKSIAAFNAAIDSDVELASCLRPRNLPVVSRRVMLHLYDAGGLDAVRHIDSVEVRYN